MEVSAMKKIVPAVFAMLLIAASASAQGGLISVKSSHDVTTTAERLEQALQEKQITVFARIDHAAGARQIGETLPPTLLIIFGSPAIGTPLIQRSRSIGLDLPLKALIWQDSAGQVWFTYTDPDTLTRRHGISERQDLVTRMQNAMAGFAQAATQP
jgi:uncharacterized protein (DUF302 family)